MVMLCKRQGVGREDKISVSSELLPFNVAYKENIADTLDLVHIIRLCKFDVSFRVQPSDVGE